MDNLADQRANRRRKLSRYLAASLLVAGLAAFCSSCSRDGPRPRAHAVDPHGIGVTANTRQPVSSPSTRTERPKNSTSVTNCLGRPNTPGGRDPWGGCWPGPENTGSSGYSLSQYTGTVLPNGACMITRDTTIVGKKISCQMIVKSGNLALEDSSLTGEVYNYGSGSILIKNSVINGGADKTETVLGSNITIEGSDLHGNQHEVYCGNDCTIMDSWLHDNHDFGPSDHQNGFLSTGGSGYTLRHDSVYCAGHCTGDITFLGSDSDATVSRNLLVATSAAYCLYPATSRHGDRVNRITIADNIFQRGPTGKCATYGPTYGWDEPNGSNPARSGYRNVWTGNLWDDGEALGSP